MKTMTSKQLNFKEYLRKMENFPMSSFVNILKSFPVRLNKQNGIGEENRKQNSLSEGTITAFSFKP